MRLLIISCQFPLIILNSANFYLTDQQQKSSRNKNLQFHAGAVICILELAIYRLFYVARCACCSSSKLCLQTESKVNFPFTSSAPSWPLGQISSLCTEYFVNSVAPAFTFSSWFLKFYDADPRSLGKVQICSRWNLFTHNMSHIICVAPANFFSLTLYMIGPPPKTHLAFCLNTHTHTLQDVMALCECQSLAGVWLMWPFWSVTFV